MERTYKYTFTIFTPTYNRAHTLARVYCSLRRQTFKDFEWLIVDDGSNDNTVEFVSQWIKKASFEIRYFYQENAGKHVAINRGVELAQGKLFLIADSDDSFVSTAFERLYHHWSSIPQAVRNQFSAVACHCLDEQGHPLGKRFPFNPTDSNSEEMLFRYKVRDEKWAFQRTDVLKQFPFPEIRSKCFPEAFIWNRIAKKYKVRFVNEYLRIYHQDAGSQLMQQSIEQIASSRFFYADSLNISSEWFAFDPFRFLKNGIQYVRLCLLRCESFNMQWKRLKSNTAKWVWFFAIIPGVLLWKIDRIKARGYLDYPKKYNSGQCQDLEVDNKAESAKKY
jgi:glycosyltransferase involved in cell wall biosynthesis